MSSSSTSHQWKHDVFVSFRGSDIRKNFISHLFKRLEQKKIRYFHDQDKDDAGKIIKDKIFGAIHHARIALAVLSENYADSKWCLNELVEILNCKRDQNIVFIPIFFIPAAEFKELSQSKLQQALNDLVGEERDKKLKDWTHALAEVKKIHGLSLSNDAGGDEAVLIEIIVERLVKEIQPLDSVKDAIPPAHLVKVFGPFGGEGEKSWDFVNIKGIFVCYVDFIKSITFGVDDATSSDPQINYGGNEGENTFKVKLRNGEYITSFAGHLEKANGGGTLINSLIFQTDKRILGPIGREEGKPFSLTSEEAGKVIEFFGRSGDFLESIGARVEPYYPFESVGLFGWTGGSNWDDGSKHINVRKVSVGLDPSGERFIQSIKFQYEDENDKLSHSKKHGGTNSSEWFQIQIHPDEYLTSISGYMYQPNKRTIGGITSLTFQTNKRTTEPIGDEKGRHFSSPATGGKIVGFYGWSDKHLHGIGAHFKPISRLYPIKSVGPFGGLDGYDWDDGRKFNGVKKVEVMHDDYIGYINIEYDVGGGQSLSFEHGDLNRGKYPKLGKVILKYPHEYLTSISGYTQEDGAIIQSLTLYSNRRSYGPYGKETGKYFWYPSTGSKIIGFYGRCSKKLNAIGVYARPIPRLYPFKTLGPFGGFGGASWDDGVHTDVRGFHIIASDVIHSIGIVYDNNGSLVEGSRHGGEHGSPGIWVNLDFPKERLISMSGFVKGNGNSPDTTIHDLKIRTTKSTRGPYAWTGESENARGTSTSFIIPSEANSGRIVGFFGRAGSHLNSIGARLEEPYED